MLEKTGAPRLQQVADGVHAYVQPDGGWCVNNAGIVRRDGATALVDTAATERRTLALAEAVDGLAPGGPDYVVNTHFHGDHTFGNGCFKPRAVIVAHENCARDQEIAGPGLRGLWPQVEWGATPIVLPDIVYPGPAASLDGFGGALELLHPGPAHTEGDTVVWLPEDGVLFAGDIVWSGITPFCLMGSVTGSLKVLDALRALGADVVVPGHGPVGGPGLIDETGAYLTWLLEVAEAGLRAGLSPLDAARAADPGVHRLLADPERIVGNLHRAYADLTAGRPDQALAFAEMVEFHGGLPACHA
ncbi:MBL fold metallo-hydrolase [Actinocorallia aurea]